MNVFIELNFEAAHHLPNLPEGHKCRRLHGHSYRVEIHVRGAVNPDTGMVIDFAEIKAASQPFWEQLDHHYLNDVEGLSNPTSENLAVWIWERLVNILPLARVVVRETCTTGVDYTGPQRQ